MKLRVCRCVVHYSAVALPCSTACPITGLWSSSSFLCIERDPPDLLTSLFSNTYECSKTKEEWGRCASPDLDGTKECGASLITVLKNDCVRLSFFTSLHAAFLKTSSQKGRGSVFAGNQSLWFVWGGLLGCFFSSLSANRLSFSLELYCHKRWRFWIAYVKYFCGSGIWEVQNQILKLKRILTL